MAAKNRSTSGKAFADALDGTILPVCALHDIGQVMRSTGKCHFSTITVGENVEALAADVRAVLRGIKAPKVAQASLSQAEAALAGFAPYVETLLYPAKEGKEVSEIGAGIEGLACAVAFHLNNAARAAGFNGAEFEISVA
jgi:hypothetical protein